MRITIKNAVNAQTVLCDGPTRGLDRNVGPLAPGIVVQSSIGVQPAERFRAPTIRHFNRQNASVAFDFSVAREMQSLQAAEAWQLTFQAACIREGTLHFEETDSRGNRLQWQLSNAFIPTLSIVPMGVSREIRYSIVGGQLTQ